MNEIKPLLDLLGGEQGRLVQVIVWIGALRVPMKLLSGQVQGVIQRALDRVVSTEDKGDDALAAKVLASAPYRLLAFAVDMIASVKLPLKLTEPKP